MQQRLKKPFIWLLLLTLIVSLTPTGLSNTASAASSLTSTTYFSPDDLELRGTVSLTQEPGSNQISRDTAYLVTSPTIDITGTYAKVSGTTLSVKVELLNWNDSTSTYETDSTHTTTGTVTQDSTNPSSRFVADNLTLFAGYNKITFTGRQGNLDCSESFYVLYDKVPYVKTLQILESGKNAVNLNEGSKIVVENATVTLQGTVQNATKVTIAVNDDDALQTSLLTDGTFFTPTLTLESGANNLTIVVLNGSDSITIKRTVYYFDKNDPFTAMYLMGTDGTAYDLLTTKPIWTDETSSAQYVMQVLLPYGSSSSDFLTDHEVKVNNTSTGITILKNTAIQEDGTVDTSQTGDADDEVIIPGADGVTPAYRLVTFLTDAADFQTTTSGTVTTVATAQTPLVSVKYGNFSSSIQKSFQYLPGEKVITNMYYLPGYTTGADLSDITKTVLNGAEVSSSDFYILVESSTTSTDADDLTGQYYPLAGNMVSLSLVTTSGNQQVYKVTGFSSGQQKVKFAYTSTAPYDATITYVSKNYIYVDNLYDGQTYTFDSNNTSSNTLKITGQYIGFENISSPQYFINGISGENMASTDGVDVDLGVTNTSTSFSLELYIRANGPLVYGENKIVFSGISMDASGNKHEVRKELRIYIVDTNESNIKQFKPQLVDGRPDFPTKEVFDGDSTTLDEMITKIFAQAPEFVYSSTDEKYTTNEENYDLVIRGGGATILNLYLGTTKMFTMDLPASTESKIQQSFTFDGTTYYYDFTGNQSDFLLRIRALVFTAPGSHIYNLELINSTGARTSQRLDVTREVTPYRILSPVPTVGDQIVVNKNFVRFDIEAEDADQVLIGKVEATKRTDLNDRFVYDYVGLKADKVNTIKISIVRDSATTTTSVDVYYTSTIAVDSQYMAEKVSTKYSVFNKAVQLTFPKGTVMESTGSSSGITKFYPDTKLLFGIADPKDGVVERRNDYGNIINVDVDARTEGGTSSIQIPADLVLRFNSTADTVNFSRVSDIYWISGGVGELGDSGTTGYKPATNGLAPYSIEGNFTQFPAERKITPSKEGTLTLTFNDNVVDEVGSTVTVFRYTDDGQWENVGGAVDTKSHTIEVPFDEFGYYTVMKLSRGYSDITNHPWARNYLNALYSKGIMNNLRYDAFGADDQTTRGEFATLLVKGLNIPLNYDNDNQTFFDVVPGSKSATWDYEHIETAAQAGIVTGLSDGFFSPDSPLTREQAAVMIARALKLKLSTNDSKLSATVAKSFTDSGSIDYYALPSVQAVTKAKIMEGAASTSSGKTTYTFNPKGNLTRAEAGKIAVELLKQSTSLFPKTLS
ncbi:S-layer homology domain-containing protein [Paenibacillus pinistramenti]|uniref:S-layer homology domain-containing protein n=1 Tax=Paenibacillus pinistramenti TaxID=1768003 RepID=UPI001396858A|nr:S-layer homology domain-containing protein [Paenibacillus pinistramenti]